MKVKLLSSLLGLFCLSRLTLLLGRGVGVSPLVRSGHGPPRGTTRRETGSVIRIIHDYDRKPIPN